MALRPALAHAEMKPHHTLLSSTWKPPPHISESCWGDPPPVALPRLPPPGALPCPCSCSWCPPSAWQVLSPTPGASCVLKGQRSTVLCSCRRRQEQNRGWSRHQTYSSPAGIDGALRLPGPGPLQPPRLLPWGQERREAVSCPPWCHVLGTQLPQNPSPSHSYDRRRTLPV